MSTTLEINEKAYGQLLAKSLPRPILNEAEHTRFTAMLLKLDEPEDLSAEEEALAEVLTESYEAAQYPLPRVSPAESLRTLMEERGLKHKGVWPVLGNKGAATEVLNGRRQSVRRRRNGWLSTSSCRRSSSSSDLPPRRLPISPRALHPPHLGIHLAIMRGTRPLHVARTGQELVTRLLE